MGRHPKAKTKEQQQYVDSILRKKNISVRKRKLVVDPFDLMTKEQQNGIYIKNCIYWINEYLEGRTYLKRAKSAVKSLQENLEKSHDFITN